MSAIRSWELGGKGYPDTSSATAQLGVRAVIASALSAYTNVAGVLTANANGALASQDGVALAANDIVLLAAGAALVDNGLYVVTSLGSASTPFILTRHPCMVTGFVPSGFGIDVDPAGTTWGGSMWKLMTTGPITIGTTGLSFYPRVAFGNGTLSSGSIALTALWLGPKALFDPVYNGAFSSQGSLRVSASAVGAGTGTATITSSSGSDATPVQLQIINF